MKTAEKGQSATQARGRERRQQLIESARFLLESHAMDALSLADIAANAGIPTGSAYHFFPNVTAVYQALGERFSDELDAELSKPYRVSAEDGWLSIIDESIDRAHRFYKASGAYRQLIIGARVPAELKLSDRLNDEVIGQILINAINDHFYLPEIPRANEIFFHVVEIIDLFFTLSVLRNDEITEHMSIEAGRASKAYLLTYFPSVLTPRDKPSSKQVPQGV